MYSPEEIEELFEKHEGEYNFDTIVNKRSKKSDLHAFLLLDELVPNKGNDIIGGADHDVIYLGVELNELEDITEYQIIELIKCGVHISDGYLQMFV